VARVAAATVTKRNLSTDEILLAVAPKALRQVLELKSAIRKHRSVARTYMRYIDKDVLLFAWIRVLHNTGMPGARQLDCDAIL
jgi:hypothetical protein